jgi:dihydroorotate dehydrogenase (fumarate)
MVEGAPSVEQERSPSGGTAEMSVNLSTTYLGLNLRNPLVAAASPLTGDLDVLRRMEEAGAAAVVLPSLFEEQLERDAMAVRQLVAVGPEAFEQVLTQLPELDDYNSGPAGYLRHIKRAKAALSIPVIASLSGSGNGDWTQHARLVEDAGADALELNVYFVPTDPETTANAVESRYIDLVGAVVEATTIPVAVKLGPYFSSLPNLARRLIEVGADGLVLFNRYLQPDIAVGDLEVNPHLALSTRDELRLPLRWIAILRSQVSASLAGTSGVHTAEDVVKLILAGADAVMMASALLRHGPSHFRALLDALCSWFSAQPYDSVASIQGRMSAGHCPDPSAFERANYVRAITSFSDKAR